MLGDDLQEKMYKSKKHTTYEKSQKQKQIKYLISAYWPWKNRQRGSKNKNKFLMF